jgi:divalent metal cation (Fe/Co/Zn/Cd) transporter
MLSEALHSALDLSAAITYFTVRYVSFQPEQSPTYGHGKTGLEHQSNAVISGRTRH